MTRRKGSRKLLLEGRHIADVEPPARPNVGDGRAAAGLDVEIDGRCTLEAVINVGRVEGPKGVDRGR